MKKNIINLKSALIILIVFLLASSILTCTSAFVGNINEFDSEERNINGVTPVIDNIGGTVISVIRVVAVTIAMVMLLVIAMRYMVAAPGERADLKKHATAYVIGAFILFGVTGILTILVNFASQITRQGGNP